MRYAILCERGNMYIHSSLKFGMSGFGKTHMTLLSDLPERLCPPKVMPRSFVCTMESESYIRMDRMSLLSRLEEYLLTS